MNYGTVYLASDGDLLGSVGWSMLKRSRVSKTPCSGSFKLVKTFWGHFGDIVVPAGQNVVPLW